MISKNAVTGQSYRDGPAGDVILTGHSPSGAGSMRWGIFLLCVPLLLAACWGPKEVEWHQKLTLHLQTPDGPASFSSVTAMRCEAGYAMDIGGTKVHCRQTGEALVAQMGERHLFVLLAGEQLGYRGVFEALIEDGDTYRKYWKRIKRAEGRAFDVPCDRWPMFVSFEDVRDPASVFSVDPDGLAAVFGEGYAVERLTVEVTDQPVTEGAVEAVLGSEFFEKWAKNHQAALNRGLSDAYFDSFASEMNRNKFLRGLQ